MAKQAENKEKFLEFEKMVTQPLRLPINEIAKILNIPTKLAYVWHRRLKEGRKPRYSLYPSNSELIKFFLDEGWKPSVPGIRTKQRQNNRDIMRKTRSHFNLYESAAASWEKKNFKILVDAYNERNQENENQS